MRTIIAYGYLIGLMFSCQIDSVQENISPVIPETEIAEGSERLYKQNGILYLDTILYSGFTVVKSRDGKLLKRSPYYNGILEGAMTSYYSSGQVRQLRPYKNGMKHGKHVGFYPNGVKQFEYLFNKGLSEGTHYEWYANGDLRSELNYKNGREFGQQRVWRPDGKLKSNYITKENGRQYGFLGLKRCAKIDSKTGDIDPYTGKQ